MTTSEASSVPFRVLGTGGYAAAAGDEARRVPARVYVASSQAEASQRWTTLIGSVAMPSVDFAKESVVFLMLGMRSTGGYAVVPEAVTVKGDGVTVTAQTQSPARGDIVTQAFSAPYAVIAVGRPGIHSAVWVSAGKVVAKTE